MSAFLVPHRQLEPVGEATVCEGDNRPRPSAPMPPAKEDPWQPRRASGPGHRRGRGYFTYQGGRRIFVINRRRGEGLTIDANLEVVVLEVRDGCVKLGIFDPASAADPVS